MEEKEPIMLDYDTMINFISEKSGLDNDTILKVLDLETEYVIQAGIIET